MSRTVFWATLSALLLTIFFGLVWIECLKIPFITDKNVEGYAFLFAGICALVGFVYQLYEKANDKPKPIHYLSSPPANLISGAIPRTDELRQLHRVLLPTTKPVVIYAVGGLGKTTLSQMYCDKYGGEYVRVVWLSASTVYSNDEARQTENAESFLRAFIENKALIENLQVTFEDNEIAIDRFRKIINCLVQFPGRNLLVIDNAPDVAAHYMESLSQLREWRILLTSRDAIQNMEPFQLGTLSPHRAAQLYFNVYGKHSTDSELDTILNDIGYHTLTIELLAAYARDKKLEPPALLLLLREKGLARLDDYEVNTPRSAKTQDIAAHLRDVFLLELDEDEKEILRNCCILPTSNVPLDPDLVSEDSLCALFGKEEDASDFKKRLRRLARMNWLVESEGGYRCHPVIAETAKAQLGPDAVKCEVLIKNVTVLLIPDKATNEPGIKRAPFGALAEAVFKGVWKEEGDFEEDDKIVASLGMRIASLCWHLGNNRKRMEFNLRALSIREKVLSAEHPDLASSYNNLAETYGALGEQQKRLESNQKALSIWEKVLPADHPDLASSYNNLAETYGALGEQQKRLEYNQKALSIWEKILSADHPNLALTYNNLAVTHYDLREYQKSLEYHIKALSILEMILPADHPNLADSYSNLAETYCALGEYNKRIEYHQKALTIREKMLPADHPSLALSFYNIAWTYHNLGDLRPAVDYMRRAGAIWGKSLPASHPYNAMAKKSLATLEQKLKGG